MLTRASEAVEELTFFSIGRSLSVSLLRFDPVDRGAEIDNEKSRSSYELLTANR
jgi:hypothetical protein